MLKAVEGGIGVDFFDLKNGIFVDDPGHKFFLHKFVRC